MVELIESETGWPAPAALSFRCRRHKQLLIIPALSSPLLAAVPSLSFCLYTRLDKEKKKRPDVPSKDVNRLVSAPWPIDSSALIVFTGQDEESVDVSGFLRRGHPQEKPHLIVFPASFVS